MQPEFICHKLYEEFLSEEIYSLGELTEQKGIKRIQDGFVSLLQNLLTCGIFLNSLPV